MAANGSGLGLSDPVYSAGRRKMLDLVNRLHSTGVQRDVDLPVIAVIGSQSAGKSSLIESISGITLPRASGTCTRCPTECRLSYSAEPWRCRVSLRFTTDADGQPLGQARNEQFGELIFNKAEVEERIRRAQRAILNPSVSPRHFLDGLDEDPDDGERTFSSNCVSLEISGNDVADLSFCDLPGLIASVGKGGSTSDIDLVKSLVTTYVSRPSCIILLTVACETDFENQGAHNLTKLHDPEGKRTIGVLTKPDRIPPGEEDRWIRFIKNEYEALDNGWFSVKQPDSRALAAGISWADARKQEKEYFSSTSPWSELGFEFQNRLGTANLTHCLSNILTDLIAKRLPELQDELQALLHKTEDGLRQLPKPPSSDAFAEILHLISEFCRDLTRHLEGTPDEAGLLQAIQPLKDKFRMTIRETAPDFRPYKKLPSRQSGTYEDSAFSMPDFLSNEEQTSVALDDSRAIYIDQVMDRAKKAVTRELPDHYPFVVSKDYIVSITSQWHIPTRTLFDSVQKVLNTHVKQLVAQHFSKFSQGGLQQTVTIVLSDYIKICCEETAARITWLLELEQRPSTLNSHYYADYRDKFMSFYRAHREDEQNGAFVNKMKRFRPYIASPASTSPKGRNLFNNTIETRPTELQESMAKIFSGLAEVGIPGIEAIDLPKLLPPDPYEPALNIMATVRAYFQVAYKRFVDYVPMAVDYELVLGLHRNGGLETALLKGLGISGEDGPRRCKEFLQEPQHVVTRRQELQKRWERLDTAKKELMELWL
ncbi:hypothetical protein WOLCODRAFT_145834 [Wolfiporia cocos MD-104 SS10]|uniref:P-loop containing nucleoside triphosphate hydrolase protein n=1 Tax=Wolfiporia cocos (strain MD-104) TaxID=742152 RepID=A0A2H3JFL6_WOLCO|nr:hypothetical protein WOLCODRAFT_145834 [Wolfiporia cocos MD-104 SS10]